MHDIRLIRDNPEAFDAGLARRGLEPVAASLLALDEERRALARSVSAEMHSGFIGLRSQMPVNIRAQSPSPAIEGDLSIDIERV